MIDEKTIESLRSMYAPRELHLLPSKSGDAIAIPPSRAEWKRFRHVGKDDRLAAAEALVRGCVVYVEGQATVQREEALATLDALFDARPALPEVWSGQLAEIAGIEEIEAKKL